MNYLTSRYLPVMCSDGSSAVVAPSEVGITEDGRVPVSFTFADNLLNFFALELVAGLFQVLLRPESEREWTKAWRSPPSTQDVQNKLSKYTHLFELHGEAPAFQDKTIEGAKEWGIDKIFHQSNGEITRKHNKDLFGGDFESLGVGTVMVALFGMQSHAYQGGPGFRTSIAGGGPLRTIPDVGESLFHKAWAMVLPRQTFDEFGDGSDAEIDVFPWVKPRFDKVTPANAPASHLYFAIPRRLLLGQADGHGICPLSGIEGPTISMVREAQKGPDYDSAAWRHPWTPYRRSVAGSKASITPLLAAHIVHGFSWNQRNGMLQTSVRKDGSGIDTALIVNQWRSIRSREVLDGKFMPITAYGVKCNQASVEGLVHGFYPFRIVEPSVENEFEVAAQSAVRGAEEIQSILRWSARDGSFTPAELKGLSAGSINARINPVITSFWATTQQQAEDYYDGIAALLESGADSIGKEVSEKTEEFARQLARAALNLFDETFRDALLDAPERVSAARERLRTVANHNKVREAFGLPLREREVKK